MSSLLRAPNTIREGRERAHTLQEHLALQDAHKGSAFPPEAQPGFCCRAVTRFKPCKRLLVGSRENDGALRGNEQARGVCAGLLQHMAEPLNGKRDAQCAPETLPFPALRPRTELLAAAARRWRHPLSRVEWRCWCDDVHLLLRMHWVLVKLLLHPSSFWTPHW